MTSSAVAQKLRFCLSPKQNGTIMCQIEQSGILHNFKACLAREYSATRSPRHGDDDTTSTAAVPARENGIKNSLPKENEKHNMKGSSSHRDQRRGTGQTEYSGRQQQEPRRQQRKKGQFSKSLQSAQERLAELMSPGKDTLMLHEESKYELLGKADDAPKVVAGASLRAQEVSPKRIHPHRLFYPGATYSPEELNPYKAKDVLMRSDLTVKRGNIPAVVVQDQGDFRNKDFLSYFVRDSGKILSRRDTNLPGKVHRALVREIKVSRCLGLMDPVSKFGRNPREHSSQRR